MAVMKKEGHDQISTNEEESKQHTRSIGRTASIIFLCFIASFLGSWIFINSGLARVETTRTVTSSREKVISQEDEIMSTIYDKVGPSVVSIVTQSGSQVGEQAAGTGIILSKSGYIMTNKHVVGDASNVTVFSSDGTAYKNVDIVGTDPLNDLAFLKIKGVNNLTPARLADSSQVKIGQKVIAIGNALGEYQNSVTSGIISGQGRPVIAQDGENDEQLDNLFQTDAAINPGNSGGPLLNLNGEVIGINTAIAQQAQGIGFAIPINAGKGMIKTLLATGKLQKAYLGVRYVNITTQNMSELGLSVKKGAYIQGSRSDGSGVVSGSPADKAGLKEKDIITKVNNKVVDENSGLSLLLAQFSPGDTVTLTFQRGNDTRTLEVTLGTYN